MNCPYCKNEMISGVIQSPYEVSWHKKRYALARTRYHKDSVLLSKLTMFRGSAAKAYICKKCEKVIIDYKGGKADLNVKNGPRLLDK